MTKRKIQTHGTNRLPKAGWRPIEWGEAAGVSRASVFKLLAAGKISSVKFGTARIITTPPEKFIASLGDAE
jgi:hypothetical protein